MPVYVPKTSSSYCNLCLDECANANLEKDKTVITVGIGGCRIAKDSCIIKTTLGSCIGITLYDSSKRIGGLIHIMLPSSSKSNGRLTKFADSGIPNLINCLISQHGALRSSMVAKIFGGARMFNVFSKTLDIGSNNTAATVNVLKQQRIRIESGKTGGTKGSQITFDVSNGKVLYKVIGGIPEEF